MKLVELQKKDYKFVEDVYNHYILYSTATFRTEKISEGEVEEMLPFDHPKYKAFVIEFKGEPCGFCYFSRYRNKQAYDRTAEVTIYLKPEFSGKGIGKTCLAQLKTKAALSGISVLIGIITAENESSVALFEKAGFSKCAHLIKVGEKFNRLLDVVAYQFILNE